MNGATKTGRRDSNSDNSLTLARWTALGLFVLAAAILILQPFVAFHLPGTLALWDGLIFVLALMLVLFSLGGQLPAQNVLLAAVVIGLIGGGIHLLGAFTGVPFGPIIYLQQSGPKLFNALPWYSPLLWILVILSSRGVARLVLRPWRKLRAYGFWLIGITAFLTILFVVGLEPFATRVRHYWVWNPTKLPIDWYGAPVSDFLGWLVTALLILAFSTPALMKKKPAQSTPEYDSLIVWLLLNGMFVAGSASQHLLAAAAVGGAVCLAVIAFAIRGARW